MSRSIADPVCAVCCEAYDGRARKCATCPHCNFEACRACIQRFITLPDSNMDPSCMGCRHLWHDDFVAVAATKSFMAGPYRKHREQLLFDRETSLMPFTQRTIEATREIAVLNRRMRHLHLEEVAIKRRRHVLARLENGIVDREEPAAMPTDAWRSTIVLACPCAGCKGFVTSGGWRCGVCDVQVCRRCRETTDAGGYSDTDTDRDTDTGTGTGTGTGTSTDAGTTHRDRTTAHVCDEERVATCRLLSTDTKPCPACASLIFKISGCDQMWCVTCHAAFSWQTGTIVDASREQVHNPEFYRYLRKLNGGEIPVDAGIPVNMRCNADGPSAQDLMRAVGHLPPSMEKRWLATSHHALHHMRSMTIPSAYRLEPDNMTLERRNIVVRRRYMLGQVDEPTFRSLLRTREKRRLRNIEFRELCDTFVQISVDVLNTLRPGMAQEDLPGVIAQLEAGRAYLNRSMVTLGRRHGGCVRMYVTDGWSTMFVR
ncbi:MAG: hypothetical protein WDW38_006524 [Sanguina aurantia]